MWFYGVVAGCGGVGGGSGGSGGVFSKCVSRFDTTLEAGWWHLGVYVGWIESLSMDGWRVMRMLKCGLWTVPFFFHHTFTPKQFAATQFVLRKGDWLFSWRSLAAAIIP